MDTINDNSIFKNSSLSAGGDFNLNKIVSGSSFATGGAAGFNGNTTTTTGTWIINSYTKELYNTQIINDPEGMLIEII